MMTLAKWRQNEKEIEGKIESLIKAYLSSETFSLASYQKKRTLLDNHMELVRDAIAAHTKQDNSPGGQSGEEAPPLPRDSDVESG